MAVASENRNDSWVIFAVVYLRFHNAYCLCNYLRYTFVLFSHVKHLLLEENISHFIIP